MDIRNMNDAENPARTLSREQYVCNFKSTNMARLLLYMLFGFCFTSCGQSEQGKEKSGTKPPMATINTKQTDKSDNALQFINSYVENCNQMKQAAGIVDWVNSNEWTTKNFKLELKKLIDEAEQREPEMGLDADPIFDAQDYPDKGFELDTFDNKTNYLTVKGKNWPEFRVTMKVINESGKWLVDGCGMINIPNNSRSER